MRRPPLELAAVGGPVLMTLAWLVLGFISPGYTMWGSRIAPYSPVSQPVSGLGLGSTAPFMNAVFVMTGALVIVGVVGIFQELGGLSVRTRWICIALLALPGLGSMIDGFFTLEHFFMHFLGFMLALTTIVTYPLVGLVLRRLPRWRRLGNWLVAAGPLTFGLAIVYFATFTPTIEGIRHGVAGLTERALILELQAWYVVLGWLAFQKQGEISR